MPVGTAERLSAVVSGAFALVGLLLVSLGLGIIYLIVLERILPLAGIAAIIGTGALIWAGKALRDVAEETDEYSAGS